MPRRALVFLTLVGLGLLLRSEFLLEAPSADASGHYTDHLRHQGEALLLAHTGFAIYRQPYGELMAQEPGLGDEHRVLFPERTAPYTPAAILLHWPLAKLEANGTLAPIWAHRAVVWLWTLIALGACFAFIRLLAQEGPMAQLWLMALALPLLVGMGINGIIDSAYLWAAALGALALQREKSVAALWWFALAAAMHFRAAVFAPIALLALWKVADSRRHLALGLSSVVLIIPSLYAAFALLGTLETIPPHNPVHFTHLKAPLLLFASLSFAVAFWFWRRSERVVALTLVAAFTLGILERSHAWWHAGTLLAPGLALASRGPRGPIPWAVLAGWTLLASLLAYRHSWSVFWQWVPFGLFGVH